MSNKSSIQDFSEDRIPLGIVCKIREARESTRNLGKDYLVGFHSGFAGISKSRSYRHRGLFRNSADYSDWVGLRIIGLRKKLRQKVLDREIQHVGYGIDLEQQRNGVYLKVYAVLSYLIEAFDKRLGANHEKNQFKVCRELMWDQREDRARGRRMWRVSLRRGLGNKKVEDLLELMREQEQDDLREKVVAHERKVFLAELEAAFDTKAAKHYDFVRQALESRIDEVYVEYVLESGRDEVV